MCSTHPSPKKQNKKKNNNQKKHQQKTTTKKKKKPLDTVTKNGRKIIPFFLVLFVIKPCCGETQNSIGFSRSQHRSMPFSKIALRSPLMVDLV